MKVLIDTNVLYSAFIRESSQFAQLIEWVMINHSAVITSHIANEILEKTALRAPDAVAAVMAFLSSSNLDFIEPRTRPEGVQLTIRDKKDQSILDAALDNDVDILITGDKDFHALDLEHPRIMTPSQFMDEFMNIESQ